MVLRNPRKSLAYVEVGTTFSSWLVEDRFSILKRFVLLVLECVTYQSRKCRASEDPVSSYFNVSKTCLSVAA